MAIKRKKTKEEEFRKKYLKIVDLIANARGIVDLVNAEKMVRDLIQQERDKAYKGGYWDRKHDDKEGKEIDKATVAHRTKEGYCCACGYDMAVLADKIKEERAKFDKVLEGLRIELIRYNCGKHKRLHQKITTAQKKIK